MLCLHNGIQHGATLNIKTPWGILQCIKLLFINIFLVTHLFHEIRSARTDVCAQLDIRLDMCSHRWFSWLSRCCRITDSIVRPELMCCKTVQADVHFSSGGATRRPRHQARSHHRQAEKAMRSQEDYDLLVAKLGVYDYLSGLPDILLHRSCYCRKPFGKCWHWRGVRLVLETFSAWC